MFKTIINKIKASPLAKRIASGAIWSILGTASAKGIVLVSGIICANILGKIGYGELGIVRSTISLFIVFGTAGLGITTTKFIAQYKNSDTQKVESVIGLTTLFSLILAICITLCVFTFAEYIATCTLKNSGLTISIRFGSLILISTILNGIYNGINVGFEKFKQIAQNTLCASILETLLIVIGAYYWGVNGAVVGFGIGVSSLAVFNYITARKALKEINGKISFFKFKKEDLSIVYKFSIPAALASFLVAPSYWIVRTLLIRFSGYGELGIYEAAEQWRIIILFIPSALCNIILPILTSNNDNVNNYKKALKINIALNVGIAFILAIIISGLSNMIMGTYGKSFDNNLPLIVLAFSTIFTAFASVVGISITSRGKMWIGFVFNFIWSCMFLLFSYIALTLNYGAVGISIALLLSYLIHSIIQCIYLHYIINKD